MPVMSRHTSKGSRKRQTWPRSLVEQLETIPESPRAPTDFDSSATAVQSNSSNGPSINSSPPIPAAQPVSNDRNAEELRRAQMLWYSHHLVESQQDRERLSQKIQELETAYRAQSKINIGLRKDIKSWQNSYDMVEAELVEAAQEIEEAKTYVRSIETSNANLRYALSQINVQAEVERQKRWRNRLQRWFGGLSEQLVDLFRSKDKHNRGSRPHIDHSREGSETPVMHSGGDKINRSGAFSRLGKHSSDPDLPSSSPQRSPLSEKG